MGGTRWAAAALVVALLGGAPLPAAGAPGAPVAGFGDDGVVGVDLYQVPEDDSASVALELGDGDLLTAGFRGGTGLGVSRFTSAGALDTSFGDGGSLVVGVTPRSTARPTYAQFTMLETVDSALMAAGGRWVIRFDVSGDLDPAFSGDGILPLAERITGATIDSLGRVLVTTASGLDRYLATGAVDTSFGGGDGHIDLAGVPGDVTVLASGRIVVGVTDGTGSSLAGFDAAGAVDTGYGTAGVLTVPGASTIRRVEQSGSFVFALLGAAPDSIDGTVRVVKSTTAGGLADGFGTGGVATVSFSGPLDDATGLTIDEDGRILVAGFTSAGNEPTDAVTGEVHRLTPAGAPDPLFAGGRAQVSVEPDTAALGTVVTQLGVVVFGATGDQVRPYSLRGAADPFFARYSELGLQDVTYGEPHQGLFRASSVDSARDLVVAPDGDLLVVGFGTTSTGQRRVAVRRFTAAGALEPTFGTDGVLLLPDGVELADVGLDPQGGIYLAYKTGNDLVVEHRSPTGAPDAGFDDDGLAAVTGAAASAGSLALAARPTAGVAVAVAAGNNVVAHVFDGAGEPDDAFSGDGRIGLGFSEPSVRAVRVLPDGSVVLGLDETSSGRPNRAFLFKLTSAGAIAPFGTAGRRFVPPSSIPDGRTQLVDVIAGGDGRLVAVGSYLQGESASFAPAARFVFETESTGTPIPTYGRAGVATVAVGDGSALRGVALDRIGQVYVAEAGPDSSRIRRLSPSGAMDATFGAAGSVTASGGRSYTGPVAVARDGSVAYALGGDPAAEDLALSAVAGDPAPVPSSFVAAGSPSRLLDTRTGNGAPRGPVGAGGTLALQVAGRGGVPAGATAAVLTVTVTQPAAAGYVTAWGGGSRPATSNVNYRAGQTVPNQAVVPLDANGRAYLFSTAATHLVADLAGWFVPAADGVATAGRFGAVTPARLLDTRTSSGGAARVPAGGSRTVKVTGVGGVPSSGVSAVALNVTVTGSSALGYVTAYPAGAARPPTSNVNFTPGETAADHVTVKVGTGGSVSFFASASTHLIVDVLGYYTDGTAPSSGAGLFVPIRPARLLDSRTANGVDSGLINRRPGGSTLSVRVVARGGVPDAEAAALVLNATVTQTAASGYVTVYPSGVPRPNASNLNHVAADTRANLVSVRIGGTRVEEFTLSDAHLLLDVFGYYQR